MNRDQYLQKRNWRSSPELHSTSLGVQTMRVDPAALKDKLAGTKQVVPAVAPVPAGAAVAMELVSRDLLPSLRQQPAANGNRG